MPKCIIHIGMHKTGSTSIQHSLGELNDASFYYARIHRSPNQSVPVYSIFADDAMTHPLNRSRGYDENTIQDYVRRTTRNLKRSIRDAGERTLLISGEGIIKLKPNELKRMRRFFEKQNMEPQIVAYMRPPMAYMTSAFQQHVKSGNLHGLDLGNFYPRYQSRFEKFDEAFGRDKVQLWKFDPPSFHEGSVVRDFCHHLGIDATALEEERKNESFSREMVAIVYQYRSWSAKSSKPRLNNRDAQALVEFLKDLPQTKLRFSPLLMAPILEEKKDDIAWAEARLGQSLAESLDDQRDGDVRSEDDLLAPVPGAGDVLRAALVNAGVAGAAEAPGTNELIACYITHQTGITEQSDDGKGWRRKNRLAGGERQGKLLQDGESESEEQEDGGPGDEEADTRPARKRGEGKGGEGKRGEGKGGRGKAAKEAAAGEPAGKRRKHDAEAPEAELGAEAGDAEQARAERRKARAAAKLAGGEEGAKPQRGKRGDRQNKLRRGPSRPERPAIRIYGNPITDGPRPLVNADKKLTVLWSPKSACTTMYVWFSHVSGFSNEVQDYAAWPHKHREEKFQLSELYERSVQGDLDANRVLKIIRDPYGRAVSIYRHALQTNFADKELQKFEGGKYDSRSGYSFQTFLDFVATLDMPSVDIHFRPQFHPYEAVRKPTTVINITSQDLFTELNKFEEEAGYPRTDFMELAWLKKLEHKRKAAQEAMAGDALDQTPFTRNQVSQLNEFPSYDQLLTPEARRKIEAIYKADFDAYSPFLS